MSASPQFKEKPRLPKTGLQGGQRENHCSLRSHHRPQPGTLHLVPRPRCYGTVLIVEHHIGAASTEAGSPDPTPRTFEGPRAPGSVALSPGPLAVGHLPQSSSASRFTAGAAGFFVLIQSGERRGQKYSALGKSDIVGINLKGSKLDRDDHHVRARCTAQLAMLRWAFSVHQKGS